MVEALEAAREAAGNDMVALMTRVFPLVTQVTTQVINNYGFTQDGVGKDGTQQNLLNFYLQVFHTYSFRELVKTFVSWQLFLC